MIQYQVGSVVDTLVVEIKSAGIGSERCKYGGRFLKFCVIVRNRSECVCSPSYPPCNMHMLRIIQGIHKEWCCFKS